MDNYKLNFDDDVIFFESDIFINDILLSYHYDKNNIMEQFEQDYPRADVYWNNKKIKNFDNFLKLSKNFQNKFLLYQKNNISIQLLLVMLINQSSYYFPYKTVYNTFQKNDDSILINCTPDNRYISFTEDNEDIVININAKFSVIDLFTNNVLNYINTSVVLHLGNCKFQKYGMMIY